MSFLATSDTSHEATHCVATRFQAVPRLTRTAVVFGPNGSGKSNLLVALHTMRTFVLHSTSLSPEQYAEHYTPFPSRGSSGKPTVFAIDVLLEDLRYRYSFSYDAERVVSEDLRVYRSSKSQRWFGRQFDVRKGVETWSPFSSRFPGARETWRKATRPRALFLTTASQLNAAMFAPLMRWFEDRLDITLSNDEAADLSPLVARLGHASFKAKVLSILHAVDFQVADVRVAEPQDLTHMQTALPDRRPSRPTVQFLHMRDGVAPVWLDGKQDSAGAQRLVKLLSPLLDGIDKDRLVAIDEFDTHLHPLVARYLVQVINDASAAQRRVQTLLVSHTTTLMDLDILRRDELWLIEVDRRQGSRMTALVQHSPRKHEMVAKAYLRGNYGAIPNVYSGESRPGDSRPGYSRPGDFRAGDSHPAVSPDVPSTAERASQRTGNRRRARE